MRSPPHCPTRRAARCLCAAGLVRGTALETVKCRTSTLEVPADADLVLEGGFDPAVPGSADDVGRPGQRLLSPHPTHSAGDSKSKPMTQRSSCVLPVRLGTTAEVDRASQGGRADAAAAGQSSDSRAGRLLAAGLGRRRPVRVLAIRKTIPLQARRAASALWGLPALQSTKFVVAGRRGRRRARLTPSLGAGRRRMSIPAATLSCARAPRRRPIMLLPRRSSAGSWASMPRPSCRANRRPLGSPLVPGRKFATWSTAAGKNTGLSSVPTRGDGASTDSADFTDQKRGGLTGRMAVNTSFELRARARPLPIRESAKFETLFCRRFGGSVKSAKSRICGLI